jgi:glycosyltransferase involved in cell wall biosynthesis
MPKVAIGIPTCRRPQGLETCLTALAALATTAAVTVIVADNDPDGRDGAAVAERLAAGGYRFPIEAVIVAERGIPQVRNAIIACALADPAVDFVVMLDDDEWPEPGWLDELLRVQAETGADVVGGSVVHLFEGTPPRWAPGCSVFQPKVRGTTGVVDLVESTANVLLARGVLETIGHPWFDPSFALTGGSDKDAFARMKRLGHRFAWADEARVLEAIPGSRVTLKWVLMRAYRVGNSDMRTLLRYRRGLGEPLVEAARIAGAFVLAPVQLALAWSPSRRVDSLCRLWRAAGKVAAVGGAHYREYATIHGR